MYIYSFSNYFVTNIQGISKRNAAIGTRRHSFHQRRSGSIPRLPRSWEEAVIPDVRGIVSVFSPWTPVSLWRAAIRYWPEKLLARTQATTLSSRRPAAASFPAPKGTWCDARRSGPGATGPTAACLPVSPPGKRPKAGRTPHSRPRAQARIVAPASLTASGRPVKGSTVTAIVASPWVSVK